MFWESLSPPGATTLLAPLDMTSERTPEFSWAVVPDATWYKLQLFDANEAEILNQWLRAGSGNVECDDIACTKTPIVILSGDFEWRIRPYNPAGLGPHTPLEFVERTSPGNYEIGDIGPGGGIVFSVGDDGTSGLEAARENATLDSNFLFEWGCVDTDLAEIDNLTHDFSIVDSHTGAENTTEILGEGTNIIACTSFSTMRPTAAQAASTYLWPGGQSGGFLPNREELGMMYDNIGPGCDNITFPGCNVGGFANDFYWSSSESNAHSAWYQHFGNSIHSDFNKDVSRRVRAVRAF